MSDAHYQVEKGVGSHPFFVIYYIVFIITAFYPSTLIRPIIDY